VEWLTLRANVFIDNNQVSNNQLDKNSSFDIVVDLIKHILDKRAIWVKNKMCYLAKIKHHLKWFDDLLEDWISDNFHDLVITPLLLKIEQLLNNFVGTARNYDVWEVTTLTNYTTVLNNQGDYRILDYHERNPDAPLS
jgi:hypothetical protein